MLHLQDLAELWQKHGAAALTPVREFSVGGRNFPFNSRPQIMGVINLSPDSWYRESVCLTAEGAIQRARVLAAEGAAIIDIGAESSLNHAARVDELLQQSRLLPVIREVVASGIIVSAETYQPVVARAALEAGARVLNITGVTDLPEIFHMAADFEAAVILCYVQGANVREVGDFDFGSDTIGQMREYFARHLETAQRAGCNKLLIDPGLGFYYRNLADSSVRVRHQMRTFLETFRLRDLGCPICHALPHAFEYFGEEVRSAEPFFAVLAALGQTNLFRTHEVARIKAVLDTLAVF
ncbi:MAG: Dihydropteroate synthase [Verrucomicrobiales bacterium]|nr:Dihydropteroate synthase [Verrucomicrobiales bacterium]